MRDDQLTDALSAVCNLLWEEREVLERVLFKLVEQQLIVEAGQTRWLAAANNEVEAAAMALRGSEVLRSAEVDALAEVLGLAPGATLAELAAAAPEPWADMLREHRDALIVLTMDMDNLVETSRRLLSAGARSVRETLLSLSDMVATYDSRGVAASVGLHTARVDAQA
jgi:hypothetical protein